MLQLIWVLIKILGPMIILGIILLPLCGLDEPGNDNMERREWDLNEYEETYD